MPKACGRKVRLREADGEHVGRDAFPATFNFVGESRRESSVPSELLSECEAIAPLKTEEWQTIAVREGAGEPCSPWTGGTACPTCCPRVFMPLGGPQGHGALC